MALFWQDAPAAARASNRSGPVAGQATPGQPTELKYAIYVLGDLLSDHTAESVKQIQALACQSSFSALRARRAFKITYASKHRMASIEGVRDYHGECAAKDGLQPSQFTIIHRHRLTGGSTWIFCRRDDARLAKDWACEDMLFKGLALRQCGGWLLRFQALNEEASAMSDKELFELKDKEDALLGDTTAHKQLLPKTWVS